MPFNAGTAVLLVLLGGFILTPIPAVSKGEG
jgi:hypothetical protein